MKRPKNRIDYGTETVTVNGVSYRVRASDSWKVTLPVILDPDLIDLIGRIQELQAELSWWDNEVHSSRDIFWITFAGVSRAALRGRMYDLLEDLLTFDPVRPHGFIGDPDELASELSEIIKERS